MSIRSIHQASTTSRWRHLRSTPRVVGGAIAVLALLGLAGCGGTPSAQKDPPKKAATPIPRTTTTTAPPISAPTVVIGGKSVAVPTDDGTPITPLQDSGQNVVLTTKGFLPRVLYSSRSTEVVYTNLTPRTVTIRFPHSPASAPATIAPGASYSYTPRSMQYEYTSSTGDAGYVVVGAFTG
jgi:hypothetical protein